MARFTTKVSRHDDGSADIEIVLDSLHVVQSRRGFDGESAWCENMTPIDELVRETDDRVALLNAAIGLYAPVGAHRARSYATLDRPLPGDGARDGYPPHNCARPT